MIDGGNPYTGYAETTAGYCHTYRELKSTRLSLAMLRELQQSDTSLVKVYQSANSDVDCTTDKSYYWHDGLLYHQWKPHEQDAETVVNQLVLPGHCRGKMLQVSLTHTIPLAEYLDKGKT